MILTKTDPSFRNFNYLTQLEWLDTNGLGGWSGSNICGAHTRRYHGLLMAAIEPPAERMLLVSKLDETILVKDHRYELGANNYGDSINPKGFQFLESFTKNEIQEWIYSTGEIRIKKTLLMIHGQNTVVIEYQILDAPASFVLEFLPLIAARFYHNLQRATTDIAWDVKFDRGTFYNRPIKNGPEIYISIPGSRYRSVNEWYYNFNYVEEKNRGLDFIEDLFNHGVFSLEVTQGEIFYVVVSDQNPQNINGRSAFAQEIDRRKNLCTETNSDTVRQLLLSADQFVVQRKFHESKSDVELELKSIIAGYHWFTDWSRDTMISLPGLCLSTGQFSVSKKILLAFSKMVSMGMLPNRFLDNREPPEYNNADGTLWYFIAIYQYLERTGDKGFIINEILPVLKEVIQWHLNGTRYNIHMESDGLLYAGQDGLQLTWMDARIGDWVVTPRIGKPVEIQALWYNAQKIFAELLLLNGEKVEAQIVNDRAEYTKGNFLEKFWNKEADCLFDNIDENGVPDVSVRPNQIFSISLPYQLLGYEQAKFVFKKITDSLFTPVGLRSLSPDDKNYKGRYLGNGNQRDSAYHQGTVWAWLLGPYIEAGMKINGNEYHQVASQILSRFAYHLNEAGIGTVSEIFDGDEPHLPRGCIAQAWSVGEILRVVEKYNLRV